MGDLRNYPEGRGAQSSKYINNVLVEFGVCKSLRLRLTIAQVNAGADLLAALPTVRWRLFDAAMIAIGGAVTSNTSVNISGLVSGVATQLAVGAQASLTQSTLLRIGSAGMTIIANGASFTQQDVNAAMRATNVGSAITVATHVDFLIHYVADPA